MIHDLMLMISTSRSSTPAAPRIVSTQRRSVKSSTVSPRARLT
jgi:hypothetical protein